MFHYQCDSGIAGYECEDSQGDEWYASLARQKALHDGWHISGKHAICATCWEDGARFTELREKDNA